MSIPNESDRSAEAARGHWTLKAKGITPEVQNAVRLAAAREKRLIGDWCVEVLYERAREVLGRPVEKPRPPARLEEVVAERLDQLWEKRLGEIQEGEQKRQAEQAERDARLREEQEQREQQMREEQAAARLESEGRMQEMISRLAREGRRGRWRR